MFFAALVQTPRTEATGSFSAEYLETKSLLKLHRTAHPLAATAGFRIRIYFIYIASFCGFSLRHRAAHLQEMHRGRPSPPPGASSLNEVQSDLIQGIRCSLSEGGGEVGGECMDRFTRGEEKKKEKKREGALALQASAKS